jgi:Ca-activated chloride channel homolog
MSEERESRLTAFALNDSGVSANERQEIEALVASDSAARQAVEETRLLAQMLSEGLAAEAILPAAAAGWKPTPRAEPPAKRARLTRTQQFVAAAAVLFAVAGATAIVMSNSKSKSDVQFEERLRSEANLRQLALALNADHSASATTGRGQATLVTSREPYFEPTTPAATSGSIYNGGGFRPGMPLPPIYPPQNFGGNQGNQGIGGGIGGIGGGISGIGGGIGGIGGGMGGVAAPGMPALPPNHDASPDPIAGHDRHPQFIENPFVKVEGQNALSTFGVDVDTASYSIVRKYLTSGQLPPADAVRLEEMVNYFPYADKPPEGADPFAVTVEMAECPWQPKHRLVRLGLKAKPIANEKLPPSNLVFLIDVSGSMFSPERLPLVKASLKLLVAQLRENDRVSLVAYAGNSGLVLDSTSGAQKDRIVEALDRLEAGGSTNGSQGIQQAYDVAEAHFIKNGTNRVILCTDGDWNVGTTNTEALVKLIEQKRETGVFLSVFGFGFGNLRDEMLVKLSGKGNGNYAYIDTLREGHKVFVEQLGGTLVTVAKDVKIQVEFNPAVIQSYRLLGYEKRLLAAKDFHDDTVDSGEMGAGHVVTALYELVPVGVPDPVVGKVDPLRYQKEPEPKPAKSDKNGEAFLLKMRHKKPDGDTSTLREMPIKNETKEYAKASDDFQFAAAVASFAMLLKDSQYKASSNYGLVLELAQAATAHDPGGYRAEFIDLVKKAKMLAGK